MDNDEWIYNREEWDDWFRLNVNSEPESKHSRVRRQAGEEPKAFDPQDVIEAFIENITPSTLWTIFIFLLVCITLPLMFCTENFCLQDYWKVAPEEEEVAPVEAKASGIKPAESIAVKAENDSDSCSDDDKESIQSKKIIPYVTESTQLDVPDDYDLTQPINCPSVSIPPLTKSKKNASSMCIEVPENGNATKPGYTTHFAKYLTDICTEVTQTINTIKNTHIPPIPQSMRDEDELCVEVPENDNATKPAYSTHLANYVTDMCTDVSETINTIKNTYIPPPKSEDVPCVEDPQRDIATQPGYTTYFAKYAEMCVDSPDITEAIKNPYVPPQEKDGNNSRAPPFPPQTPKKDEDECE